MYFNIWDTKSEISNVFVGKYKNPKLVKQKPFSIPHFGKHDITIKKLNCGNDFSQISD